MGNDSRSIKQQVVTGSFWVFGANLFSRLISLLSTLVLARLLTPEAFGVIGYGFLIVGAIGLIREMGFNSALIYQKKGIEEAANTTFWFIFLWSICLYLLVVILAPLASAFFREVRLTALLRVLTLSLVFNSLANVPMTLMEKDINFKRRIIPEVLNLTFYGIVTVIFAFLGFGYWSFVIGILSADIIQLITAFSLRPVEIVRKPDLKIFKELFGFGKSVIGLNILNFSIRNIDDFFVGRMLGTVSLGIYQFSYRIANIPATNITNVLGKVLYPGFTKIAHDQKKLKEAFLKSMQYVTYLTIPLTIYIILITPIFIHLFLPNWNDAILPIQLIAYFGGIRSISSGIGSLFFASGKPNELLSISGTQLIILLIFLYPTIQYWGLSGVCLLVNLSITVSFIWGFLKSSRLLSLKLPLVYNSLKHTIWISTIVLILAIIYKQSPFVYNDYVSFIGLGIGFPLLYGVLTWFLSDIPQKIYHDLFKNSK